MVFEKILEKQNHLAINKFHLTAIRRRLAGDPVDLGRTHLILGNLTAVMGDNTRALYHLQNALTIFEQFERQREIAMVCCNIGDVYLRRTEYALAQATLRRSLSIAEKIGEVSIVSGVFGNLGIVSARFGDLHDAEIFFRQGLSVSN